DSLRDIYSRRYLKLQEVLASVGGFIKIIMIFFATFNDYVHSNLLYQDMYLGILNKYEQKVTNSKSKIVDTNTNVYLFSKKNVINSSDNNLIQVNNNLFSNYTKDY